MDPKRVNLSREGFVARRIGTIRFSRIATIRSRADYSEHAELSGSTVVALVRGIIRRFMRHDGICLLPRHPEDRTAYSYAARPRSASP